MRIVAGHTHFLVNRLMSGRQVWVGCIVKPNHRAEADRTVGPNHKAEAGRTVGPNHRAGAELQGKRLINRIAKVNHRLAISRMAPVVGH